jgi:hypothetical protein
VSRRIPNPTICDQNLRVGSRSVMSHFFILGWTARTISQNDFAEKCLARLLGRAASMYSQCCLARQSEEDLRVVTARMVSQNVLAIWFCWCCLAGWCSRAFWVESASGVLLVCTRRSSRKCVLLLGSYELLSQCNWEKSASCDLRECSRRSRKNLLFFSSISSLISPSVPFIPANVYLLK